MQTFLLFDIDGTLIDADGAGQIAMRTVLIRDFGVDAENAEIPSAGRTDAAIFEDLFRDYGVSTESLGKFVELYLDELREVLPTRSSRLLPNVGAVLRRAAERPETSLGLLTGNLRGAADIKLAHHSIKDYFDFGVFGDRHANRDDVATEAAAAIKNNGGPPNDRVWVIGDTPADVRCARAAGFRVAAVATGIFQAAELEKCRPDLLLESLADADSLFEAL